MEPVAATLKQLWISYNLLDKLVSLTSAVAGPGSLDGVNADLLHNSSCCRL